MPKKQDEALFQENDKGDFQTTCPDGTPLNEAVSILIKEMRRGRELEALYWARQIEARYFKYLWRRLAIFCAEDVGLANPDAIVQIRALWDSYLQIRSESSRKSVDGNIVTMAVLLLCRSFKNRECDHMKNVEHVLERNGWKPEVPDYAIDAHTKRGRQEGLTQQDRDRQWFLEGSIVEPEEGPYDYRLWHWKRIAQEGAITVDEYEAEKARVGADLHHAPDSLPSPLGPWHGARSE